VEEIHQEEVVDVDNFQVAVAVDNGLAVEDLVLWRSGDNTGVALDENSTASAAIQTQNVIGWQHFLDGFLAREW
jgi:hypothetical protein